MQACMVYTLLHQIEKRIPSVIYIVNHKNLEELMA